MEQALKNFIKEWTNKPCEVAGSSDAKNQCVDLANQFIREVLRLPIIEWTNAVDFPLRVGSEYEWIENAKDNFPIAGDLVVWGPTPGHIAVAIEGDKNRFSSFDQNFPVGSTCHVQEHTYQNVKGWLRLKHLPAQGTITIPTSERDQLIGRSTVAKEVGTYLALDKPDTAPTEAYTKAIAGIRGATTACQTTLTTREKELATANREIENRVEQVTRIEQREVESAKLYEARINALQQGGSAWVKLEGEYKGRIEALEEENDVANKAKGKALLDLAACRAGNPKITLIDFLRSIFSN